MDNVYIYSIIGLVVILGLGIFLYKIMMYYRTTPLNEKTWNNWDGGKEE